MNLTLRIFFLAVMLASQAGAATFYAATNGVAGNTGAIGSPWDLQTALSKVGIIVGGDTLNLRGGNYARAPQGVSPGAEGYIYRVEIAGTVSAQIVIQSYPGEWAMIDGGAWGGAYAFHATARPTLLVGSSVPNSPFGKYVTVQNMEIYSSSTETRLSFEPDATGSFPTDIFRSDGPNIFATGAKMINCIVHDLATGISVWSQSTLSEVYGNLIYNNGWQGTPHLHGHNAYTQHNFTGTQPITIKRNIFAAPYDKNIQMYGSSAIEVARYRTSENIFIGNHPGGHGGVLIGTRNGGLADRARDNQVFDNFGYGASLSIYFQLDPNAYKDIIVTGNYFKSSQIQESSWKNALITNNTFFVSTSGQVVSLWTNSPAGFLPWTNDFNTYYLASAGAASFNLEGVGPKSITFWRTNTGYEVNSSIRTTLPATNYVIVQGNIYDSNRAQVAAYNWLTNNFIALDVSAFGWGTNVGVVVRNVQDYFGDAVPLSTTISNTIIVDMRAVSHTTVAPFGETGGPLVPTTFPMFGAFIIQKTGASPPPPPVTTFTTAVGSFNPNSGVSIGFSPNDVNGLGAGVTSFSRTNTTNVVITLVAPASTASSDFTEWDRNGVLFTTSTTAVFTNTSSTSWTAVYTTTKRLLTVNSSNPNAGVFIQMSPADTGGQSSGSTPFARNVFSGTVTTLTAPLSANNGNLFSRWNLNGVFYTTSQITTFTNNADLILESVFAAPVTPFSGNSPFSSRRRAVRF